MIFTLSRISSMRTSNVPAVACLRPECQNPFLNKGRRGRLAHIGLEPVARGWPGEPQADRHLRRHRPMFLVRSMKIVIGEERVILIDMAGHFVREGADFFQPHVRSVGHDAPMRM